MAIYFPSNFNSWRIWSSFTARFYLSRRGSCCSLSPKKAIEYFVPRSLIYDTLFTRKSSLDVSFWYSLGRLADQRTLSTIRQCRFTVRYIYPNLQSSNHCTSGLTNKVAQNRDESAKLTLETRNFRQRSLVLIVCATTWTLSCKKVVGGTYREYPNLMNTMDGEQC